MCAKRDEGCIRAYIRDDRIQLPAGIPKLVIGKRRRRKGEEEGGKKQTEVSFARGRFAVLDCLAMAERRKTNWVG